MNTKLNNKESSTINTTGIKKRRSSMTVQPGEDVESWH